MGETTVKANRRYDVQIPVANTGTTAVSGIKVTSSGLVKLSCPAKSLAAGATMTCTGIVSTKTSTTVTVDVAGVDEKGKPVAASSSLLVEVEPKGKK